MDTTELVVWSALLGSLLTLAAGASVNLLLVRNVNAVHMLLFVLVAGASSLTRTGLMEAYFPAMPELWLRLLKVCAAPLSAALLIRYTGLLLGETQDPLLRRVIVWSAAAMLGAALLLGLLVFLVPQDHAYRLLRASAIVTGTAALVGLGLALRASAQGDPLARWVAVAAGCLLVSLFGLFLRSMNLPGIGLGTWVLTAACTVAYFLLGMFVISRRIREARQLDRLARLESGTDPATGLPTGAALLTEVEHAFWRTARLHGGVCTVVCLHLDNLYALSEAAGPQAEQQILTAMAARIRRAAGFRCVVGLYHPLCFVVVISANQRRQYVGLTISRLRSLALQALTVAGPDGTRHIFHPHLGLGVVTPPHLAQARPMEVINSAEQLAVADARPALDDAPCTVPGSRQADTQGATLA